MAFWCSKSPSFSNQTVTRLPWLSVNVNDAGEVVHHFTDPGGSRNKAVLAKGAVPNGDLSLEREARVERRNRCTPPSNIKDLHS